MKLENWTPTHKQELLDIAIYLRDVMGFDPMYVLEWATTPKENPKYNRDGLED